MKIVGNYTYRGRGYQGILCLMLVLALVFTSAPMLYAAPENTTATENAQTEQASPGAGSITTDLAPEIQRPVELDVSAADTEEARELLARATPAQRAELEEFYAQLDEIDRETEIAVEEYNAARMRLDNVTGSIEASEQDIAVLEQAYLAQANRLGNRAVEIYRGSRADMLLIMIFEAESFQDLLSRIEIINQLVSSDSDLMSRIRDQRSRLEAITQQLSLDESEAASLEFEMRARMIEVTARNEDRKQELRDQNITLLELFEAEQLRRAIAEQELARSVDGGDHSEIVAVPGSPVETAMALRGIPYVWGGASRDGFDCSGLMRFVFSQHGVDLPHHSGTQVLHGQRVMGDLQPGDLIFFGTPIHHVGMYVGGGYFIHSPRTGEVVSLRSLASRSDMVAARRIDWQPRVGAPR
ncbi:MAG: NlpC/P60 family protein [Coriobacteriia bacterium]|nr:NlpC/P60 family protein [Coriobacteriia bacterium]